MQVWIFGDRGAGSLEEARALAEALEPLVPAPVLAVDRLSSRARTFARVITWGVIEPRVVVFERIRPRVNAPGAILARLDHYPQPQVLDGLLRSLACP